MWAIAQQIQREIASKREGGSDVLVASICDNGTKNTKDMSVTHLHIGDKLWGSMIFQRERWNTKNRAKVRTFKRIYI